MNSLISTIFFTFTVLIFLTSCSYPNKRADLTDTTYKKQSKESIELQKFYERTSKRLKSQGLLRTDNGAIDSPYNAKTLSENFLKIALYDEYKIENGSYVAKETKSKLKRWENPIIINIIHGETNTRKQIEADTKNIERFARRLSNLTNLPIEIGTMPGNFILLFLDENEQKRFGKELETLMPLLTPSMAKAITSSPRTTFCFAFTFTKPPKDYEYVSAIILIKSEHKNLMRKSCIHEEMAQAMGLSNDSKFAKPSIFNDDEEFALLTNHDENLLKILYDNRLQPGMGVNETQQIVTKIAKELLSYKNFTLFNTIRRD
ncbi:MAG: DUF2927 domain-containing protein [Paracoccaceae bacterium]